MSGRARLARAVRALLADVVVGGLMTGGIYALVALGLNLQYGLMRVLNVAHGEFLMLGAYVDVLDACGVGGEPAPHAARDRARRPSSSGWCCTGCSMRGRWRAMRREGLESRSLLLSFGLLFVLQNAALLIWSADIQGYSYLAMPRADARHRVPGQPAGRRRDRPRPRGWPSTCILRRSLTGKAIRALMQEPEGAQLLGIDVPRLHALCFGAGVAMSAVTGSLDQHAVRADAVHGLPYTVTALVVVILGGLGNVLGSLPGALLLGLVETAAVYAAASDIRVIASYAVLSLILSSPRPGSLAARLAARRRARPWSRHSLCRRPSLAGPAIIARWRWRSLRTRARGVVGVLLRAHALPLAGDGRLLRRRRLRDRDLDRRSGLAPARPRRGGRGGGDGPGSRRPRPPPARPYFAVFTFGLAELAKHSLIWYETGVTGTVGRLILAPPGPIALYYTVLAVAAAAVGGALGLRRSRWGFALVALVPTRSAPRPSASTPRGSRSARSR